MKLALKDTLFRSFLQRYQAPMKIFHFTLNFFDKIIKLSSILIGFGSCPDEQSQICSNDGNNLNPFHKYSVLGGV